MCENCQEQICKAFIGLTIGAKMIGGGRPLLRKILSQSDRVGEKFEQYANFTDGHKIREISPVGDRGYHCKNLWNRCFSTKTKRTVKKCRCKV